MHPDKLFQAAVPDTIHHQLISQMKQGCTLKRVR